MSTTGMTSVNALSLFSANYTSTAPGAPFIGPGYLTLSVAQSMIVTPTASTTPFGLDVPANAAFYVEPGLIFPNAPSAGTWTWVSKR